MSASANPGTSGTPIVNPAAPKPPAVAGLGAETLDRETYLLTYLDQKAERIEDRIEDRIRRSLTERTGVAVVVGVIALFGGWSEVRKAAVNSAEHKADTVVSERLDKEFSSDHVQAVIDEAARKYTAEKAETLIKNEVAERFGALDSRMDAAVTAMTSKLAEIENSNDARLDRIKKAQDSVAKTTQEQSQIWRDASLVYRLSAAAAEGSFPAYATLFAEKAAAGPAIAPLIDMTLSQLNERLRTYVNQVPVPPLVTLHLNDNGKQVDAASLDAAKLVARLGDPQMAENQRQFLAALLYTKPTDELLDLAIKAFREQNSLYAMATLYGCLGRTLDFRNVQFQDTKTILSALEKLKASKK